MYKDLMHSQNKMKLDSFTKLFLFLFALSLIPIINSEALLQEAGPKSVTVTPGEIQSITWGLQSTDDVTITVQITAEGQGSEFLSFPASMQIEPTGQLIFVPIDVVIPANYDGHLTFSPSIVATQLGDASGPTKINVLMAKTINISIIPLQKDSEVQLTEELEASSQPDDTDQIQGQVTITENKKMISPLQQVKDGIAPDDVICKESFQLLLKPSDGTPACVSLKTHQKLITRGWILP